MKGIKTVIQELPYTHQQWKAEYFHDFEYLVDSLLFLSHFFLSLCFIRLFFDFIIYFYRQKYVIVYVSKYCIKQIMVHMSLFLPQIEIFLWLLNLEYVHLVVKHTLISFIYYITWTYHSKLIIGNISVLTFSPSWFNSSLLPCSKNEGMTLLSWNPMLMTALENEYSEFFLLLLDVRQWKQLTSSWYVCFMKSSQNTGLTKNGKIFYYTLHSSLPVEGTTASVLSEIYLPGMPLHVYWPLEHGPSQGQLLKKDLIIID